MEKSDASLTAVILWCIRCLSSRLFLEKDLSHLSVYFWLCWSWLLLGLCSGCGQWGSSLAPCMAFSLGWSLLFQSTGPRAHGLPQGRHVRSGVGGARTSLLQGVWDLQNQGSDPGLLHWQGDSLPLRHQGCPPPDTFKIFCLSFSFTALHLDGADFRSYDVLWICGSASRKSCFSPILYSSQLLTLHLFPLPHPHTISFVSPD